MQPPNRPPRPGSSSRLNVVEVNEAVGRYDYTGPAPSERKPPISNRPPAELPLPPPSFRREPPEDNPSNAQPRARHQTLTGMPAPPSEDPEERDRDSGHIAADGVFRQYEAEHARAEALASELAALRRSPPSPDEVPTRSHWAALLYKLGGALVAILVPCGVYLTYRVETLGPRVDSAANRQQTQQQATTTIEERVKALESYNRALMAHSDCMDAQRDSAIERGTGHTVEGSHESVDWFQQSRPALKLRIIWETAPWYITTPCPPKPHPPGNP